MLSKLKYAMLIAFILYLGKVLILGMSIQESVFLITLVLFQAYREFIEHKERNLKSKIDEQIIEELAATRKHLELVEASVVQLKQTIGLSNITGRR